MLQLAEQMITQRRQPPCRTADPVGHRRPVKRDALAGIDLCLTVERQVIGILADQPMRDQRSVGSPPSTMRAGAGASTGGASHERQP